MWAEAHRDALNGKYRMGAGSSGFADHGVPVAGENFPGAALVFWPAPGDGTKR